MERRMRDLWKDGKVVIWILAQAGTRRWWKQEEHFIYLFIYSFSPPEQLWNARWGNGGVKIGGCDVMRMQLWAINQNSEFSAAMWTKPQMLPKNKHLCLARKCVYIFKWETCCVPPKTNDNHVLSQHGFTETEDDLGHLFSFSELNPLLEDRNNLMLWRCRA